MIMQPRSHVRVALGVLGLAAGAGCDDASLSHGDDPAAWRAQAASEEASPTDAGAPREPGKHQPPLSPRAATATLTGPDVTIRASASGSGSTCGNQIGATLSQDASELVAEYNSLNELEMTPNQKRAIGTCNAQVVLETSIPMSYAVLDAWAQGFTDLGSSVSATVAFTYAHPGSARSTLERTFAPGESELFRLEQGAKPEAAWSPCSRRSQISLRTAFTLTNGTPAGKGSVDMCATAVGDEYSHAAFKLAWRACDPEPAPEAEAP